MSFNASSISFAFVRMFVHLPLDALEPIQAVADLLNLRADRLGVDLAACVRHRLEPVQAPLGR